MDANTFLIEKLIYRTKLRVNPIRGRVAVSAA